VLSMYDDRKEYYDFLTENKFTFLFEPYTFDKHPDSVLNQKLNWDDIAQTYEKEKVVVVDDFLQPDIAQKLKNYMLFLNVRQDKYHDYAAVNFYKRSDSLWFPVLTSIVDECKDKAIFLTGCDFIRAWSFIYNNKSEGVPPHADPAAVNFNLWVTDDSSMLHAEEHNGLDIWKVYPPSEWNWETYNGDNKAIAEFLNKCGVAKTAIAYKFNRVVIFNSKFFHKTQPVQTKLGYSNRRINYTFLFGEE